MAVLTIFLPVPFIFLRPYILLLITLALTLLIQPLASLKKLLILSGSTAVLIIGWVTDNPTVFEPIIGLLVLWCYVVWILLFMSSTHRQSNVCTFVSMGILLLLAFACFTPATAEIHYVIGMKTKTVGTRIVSLTQAATLMPSNARYHRELSHTHLQAALALAATQHEENGSDISNHIAAAINEAQLAVRATPKSARTWAALGTTYLRVIGPVPDAQLWAQASFERAIRLDPQNPTYSLLLAQTYIQSNKPIQAERLLSVLVSQFPNDARAPYLYANLLEKTDPPKARSFYQIALSRADKEDVGIIQKRLDALSTQQK